MRHWTAHDLLTGMQSGEEQPDAAIQAFVDGVVSGDLTRPQAAAWLAWAWRRGLSDRETVALTHAMTHSGAVLSWGEGPVLADKHSTGGVGDKVSLVLAPLWAELGWRVPMISGRGLGHTGGTLDKLEAIPGFRTDLEVGALERVLADVGCFISGQTAELAPADRALYALRNETSTVDSISLIVGSILSKKLAEGAQRLVLDVKVGSGAFMKDPAAAAALASALVRVARDSGIECSAVSTAMDRPLGCAVGNAEEVDEAMDCLRGEGPSDLRQVVLALTEHAEAGAVLASGAAYERFARMVAAQGGDLRAFQARPRTATEHVVRADRSGWLTRCDAFALGRAAFMLGAGRESASSAVDPDVGLRMHVEPGQAVVAGDPLVTLLHRDGRGLGAAMVLVREACEIADRAADMLPLIGPRW
ncbi:MAG: pyrimidine-nucleoside phosphorylase [Myxococcota bacterium]|jgi:pyrimidine-nucleoside phosphorylase